MMKLYLVGCIGEEEKIEYLVFSGTAHGATSMASRMFAEKGGEARQTYTEEIMSGGSKAVPLERLVERMERLGEWMLADGAS